MILQILFGFLLLCYWRNLPLAYCAETVYGWWFGPKFADPRDCLDRGVTQRLRAWLGECDFNVHFNNASYTLRTDVARMVLFAAMGVGKLYRESNWRIHNGGTMWTFRKEIRVFKLYDLETRVASWDDRWMYVQSTFYEPDTGKVHCTGLCKMTIKDKRETVPPVDFLRRMTGDDSLPAHGPNAAVFTAGIDNVEKTLLASTKPPKAKQ